MDRYYASRLVTIAVLFGAIGCTSPRPMPKDLPRPVPDSSNGREANEPDDLVGRVVEAHNSERVRRKRAPLVLNPRLTIAAMRQARDMAERRQMTHKGSDGSSPFDRIKQAGYRYQSAGENVAYGFDDVTEVMSGWMRSPGHRRNILGDYTEVGVGLATARDGASYWCVTFGTPGLP